MSAHETKTKTKNTSYVAHLQLIRNKLYVAPRSAPSAVDRKALLVSESQQEKSYVFEHQRQAGRHALPLQRLEKKPRNASRTVGGSISYRKIAAVSTRTKKTDPGRRW